MKSLIAALAVSFLIATQAYAHPGRTASDGCHYCRTNCSQWGVPWNERHCHNGHNEDSHGETLELSVSSEHQHKNDSFLKTVNHQHPHMNDLSH
jgi:hypothetical protein